jgi:hypothetical protein
MFNIKVDWYIILHLWSFYFVPIFFCFAAMATNFGFLNSTHTFFFLNFQTSVSFCIHKYSFAIMGKKNKIKKTKNKGDKINLLSNKMQYQEC